MLSRIALHQTRLHTPGVGLDSKGVALGAKGIVLLPSIGQLVTLLATYTRERSLEDMMPTLAIHAVRSKLGTREIAFEFAAESSDRMDRIAETARLVGGFTFTGTSRHFVQYRDSAAPFGYDATHLLSTDAALALYHHNFSQTYDLERRIDLRTLLLRLMPRLDPSLKLQGGPRIVLAEEGLGPALVHYFVRSHIEGDVCVAEWPSESELTESPIRRYMIRIPELPVRMRQLVHTTPGISCFVPTAAGVAVEAGYRHPVELRACPVFDSRGLVLLRGRGDEPWVIDRVPVMGPLSAFARVEMRSGTSDAAIVLRTAPPEAVRVPLRVVRSSSRVRNVNATWISPEQMPLLRQIAYALPHATIAQSLIATTAHGAFMRSQAGIEGIPLGTFFSEVHPNLYVAAGYRVTPAVAPDVLARSLDARPSIVLFIGSDGRVWGVEEPSFVPLEGALLEAPPWEPVVAERIDRGLVEAVIDLKLSPLGLLPARGIEPLPDA